MSRELTPEEDARVQFKSLPGQSKYPWDQWFNGKKWVLEPGVDFTSEIRSFRTALYNAARDRGKHVKTRYLEEDNRLVIQVYKSDW